MSLAEKMLLLLLVAATLQLSFTLEDEADARNASISGVYLPFSNSTICTEMDINMDSFSLCSFVRLVMVYEDGTAPAMIFNISDESNSLLLEYKNWFKYIVTYNGNTTEYIKTPELNQWMKICIANNNSEINLRVNYLEPKKVLSKEIIQDSENEENIVEHEKNHISHENVNVSSFTSKDGKAILCIGGNRDEGILPSKIEVAGLIIDNDSENKIRDKDINDLCFEEYEIYQSYDFNDDRWKSFDVNHTQHSLGELCSETYVVSLINKISTYGEHVKICRALKGRLPSVEEVLHFIKYFPEFSNPALVGENFWLIGGNPKAMTIDRSCPCFTIFANNSQLYQSTFPCILQLQYNFCISPALTEFEFYGSVFKYDTKYILQTRNNSIILYGNMGSSIKKVNEKWILRSLVGSEPCELTALLPVGRNKWYVVNDDEYKVITLTHCRESEFTCTDGECLPWNVRCNGITECEDDSDEEKCALIVKNKGYSSDKIPPPMKNDFSLKIFYTATIHNIEDIISATGFIVVDINFSFSWYDSRLVFWNPQHREDINCPDIWTPPLYILGDAFPGFQIKFEDRTSTCTIVSSPSRKNKNRVHPREDPYMGTYIKGNNLNITNYVFGLMKVPCQFDLRRYPFGSQSCNITLSILSEKIQSYRFISTMRSGKDNDMQYSGNRELGEYHFISADHKIDDATYLIITINLKNLYGFHMLNSFTPSFLITIISFATLFFPMNTFSERVMISLTALLVLAALYTQASNTSVITPYFKLLDIWYVVMIFYSFLLVIFNIVLHKVMTMIKKKQDKLLPMNENDSNEVQLQCDVQPQWKISTLRFNFWGIIFFSCFYLIFIFFFCLAAAEII